jgi:hypothetical protein
MPLNIYFNIVCVYVMEDSYRIGSGMYKKITHVSL